MESAHQHDPYLAPYRRAAERHGPGFEALLWASPRTQRARFDVIAAACQPREKFVLDVGCGRADLLLYLKDHRLRPARYIGIEAVDSLAVVAATHAEVIRADFVREPARMFVGADTVIFSGSLNTLEDQEFRATLGHAWQAAGEALVFNFLCSPDLAAKDYLRWRSIGDVERFARELSPSIRVFDDYLTGDCTVCLLKADADCPQQDAHA